jgi:hypothetical protein
MRGQMIDEATRKGMDMFNRPIETEQQPPAQAVALAESARRQPSPRPPIRSRR